MIGSEPSRRKCEDAERALLPLPEHVYSLYTVAAEQAVWPSVPPGMGDWLILAAGLREVSIVTNGLGPGDDMCSNIYEEARGPASGAVATELTRLLFLWGALQGLMRAKWGRRREQGQPRLIAQLVGERAPVLLHQQCAAANLLAALERHRNEPEYAQVLGRARRLDAGDVGQATFASYQLRNSLAHGAVPWPDDDSVPSSPAVYLASTATRVLSFAVQCLLLDIVPADCEVMDSDGEDWRWTTIGELLPRAHLAAS